MAVSMLRLRKLPGVNRPAIACLWPNRGPQGFAVMLDVGADVKAEAPDLLHADVLARLALLSPNKRRQIAGAVAALADLMAPSDVTSETHSNA